MEEQISKIDDTLLISLDSAKQRNHVWQLKNTQITYKFQDLQDTKQEQKLERDQLIFIKEEESSRIIQLVHLLQILIPNLPLWEQKSVLELAKVIDLMLLSIIENVITQVQQIIGFANLWSTLLKEKGLGNKKEDYYKTKDSLAQVLQDIKSLLNK